MKFSYEKREIEIVDDDGEVELRQIDIIVLESDDGVVRVEFVDRDKKAEDMAISEVEAYEKQISEEDNP